MDAQDLPPTPVPIEPPPDNLLVKEGDSASTREQKSLLRELSWSQKFSLGVFALFVLAIPLTMAAVYGPLQFSSQARTNPSTTKPLPGVFPTLSPSPTPAYQ